MQRLEAILPGGSGVRLFGALLALALGASACGGDEDCSVTNSCPNQPPAVTISSPAANASIDEFQTVTFTGSATDPEDGALTGSALVWTSSIDGALGTGTSFTRDDLSPGSHVVTLTATDGDGRSGTATRDLTVNDVPNEKPAVTITQPADGGSAMSGASVSFAGTATDPEEGALSGAALVWTSDLDGSIGTGTNFSTSTLSGGTHELVLTATDSQGAFGADTISFSVTGAPSISITAPTEQASGAVATMFTGASVTFTGSATDAEDGPLTGASLVWTSNVDGQIGTGASFSTTGLSAGMHTVTLTATDSDSNEAKETVLVIVKPPAAAGYQIHIRWSEGVELTTAQRTAVTDAVTKLQTVITGDVSNLPTSDFDQPTPLRNCGGATVPHMQESIDDVIIYLEFVPIDGPNGTVGSAGPCLVRNGTALTLVGGMRFDTDDLAALESFGLMDDIILHEMMHVLGFGIFWESPVDFLEQPSDPSNPTYVAGMTDTHFTGDSAISKFNAIGGTNYTGGAIVPVENDTTEFSTGSLDGHWRESVFSEEIMTPAANVPSNPLSVLTIASFDDLGYTVDYGAADTYNQTFSIVFGPQTESPRIDLSGDVWRGPIQAVDPDGSRHRIR